MAIERNAISQKSQYVAIKNPTYVQLADELGIRDTVYSSANNTGNVMESLCWLAYEQKKYNFILSIVKFAADFEYPDTVARGPAAAVAPGPAVCPPKRPAAASGPAVPVASGPAAAIAPGPAKLPRKQTFAQPTSLASSQSSGSASGRPQASSQRDVQKTAASASGHQATPASGESSGRRAAVQDREPSTDEEDYGECRCMSTWTRAKLKDYAKLNKHAVGRHEEMERQAAWFDEQVEEENSTRQERSNRGQPLERLRQTTTVPGTKLPTYLDAYLSLCGEEDSEVWDRRFETLAQRFGGAWSVLRDDIALSVAEPKQRSEKEVDEALASFKLAYKETPESALFEAETGPKAWNFFRDIFQDKEKCMEYLRSGTLARFEAI